MQRRQRRLLMRRLRDFTLMKKQTVIDSEGVPETEYAGNFVVKGYIWPATSKRQLETYGDRIENVSNFRIEGNYTIDSTSGVEKLFFPEENQTIDLGDGVCVYTTEEPDYRIVSFTNYYPLLMEIEKI